MPTVADWSLDVACRPSRRARTCRASSPGSTPSTSRSTPRRCAAEARACWRCSAPRAAASRRRSRSSCASARRSRASRACSNTRAASSSRRARGASTVWVEVVVPVKSLCPCSKEISDYGAHNQRSHVTIRVEALGELVVARAGALRRGFGIGRDLVVAQARRREVDHRARLREPEVRRGHGARRRAEAERRCAHRALHRRRRELRNHPRPQRGGAHSRADRREESRPRAGADRIAPAPTPPSEREGPARLGPIPAGHAGANRRIPVSAFAAARAGLGADAARARRIAQQVLDLRVDAAQLGGGEALDLGPERRVDAQQEATSCRGSPSAARPLASRGVSCRAFPR